MSILQQIKKSAIKSGAKIQSSEASRLETILNTAFLKPKNPEKEVEFVKHVLHRGTGSTERTGLHASALIKPENEFCYREQVFSLLYDPIPSEEQYKVSLLRIFEEGNAIHEKWQRLFVRAGWSNPTELDATRHLPNYRVSFTPDILCTIPEFGPQRMIGEIKSVNTFQFSKMVRHPTAGNQLQWYMFLTGVHDGFVLSEDKNTQDIKVEIHAFDPDRVGLFIERLYRINDYFDAKKIPKRHTKATGYDCKLCQKCSQIKNCWRAC